MSISGIRRNDSTLSYKTTNQTTASSQKATAFDEMTMGEYKKYVYEKISDIQNNHLSSGASSTIDISEEGFKAMKGDPEYENWVFNQLESSISTKLYDDPYLAILHVGKNRGDLQLEVWKSEKQNKKTLSKKLEEDYLKKKYMQKKIQAKNEHYAQYRRILLENSIRKADIENEHIKGQFGESSGSQSLTAIASYRTILNSNTSEGSVNTTSSKTTVKPKENKTKTDENKNNESTENNSTSVALNAEKRSRQLAT